jgi:hypothetical protein
MRIAVLDDYQDVARGMADWAGAGEVELLHDHISGTEDRAVEAIRAWQGGAPIRLLQ